MTCEVTGCTSGVHAKNLCNRHYERQRERTQHREDQLLYQRARNRAIARLVKGHYDEFVVLWEEEKVVVAEEAQRLAAAVADGKVRLDTPAPSLRDTRNADPVTPPPPPRLPRLKSGPHPVDEPVESRIREDVGRCPLCHEYHDGGHKEAVVRRPVKPLDRGTKPIPRAVPPPRAIPAATAFGSNAGKDEAAQRETVLVELRQGTKVGDIAAVTSLPLAYIYEVADRFRDGAYL